MNKKILSLAVLVLTLAGCGSKYKMCPLKHVKRSKADCAQRNNDIEVRVKRLTPKKIGKVAGGQKTASTIVPLLMTIKNSSDQPVCLDNNDIGLKILSAEKVSHFLSKPVPLYVLAGVFAVPVVFLGIFLGPLAFVSSIGYCSDTVGMCVAFCSFLSATSGATIIAGKTAVESYTASTFNKKLSQDLKQKVVSQHCIQPYKKESVLLFVREKDLPESFDVTLVKGEEDVPFFITLPKK